MSVLGDDEVGVSGSSFWEIDNYKRTVRRLEDGQKLCDELMKLIRERAQIEKEYATKLRGWSKTWSDRIDKGPEYGTTASAWKGVLTEADRMADVHLQVCERLREEVEKEIALWKKENFKKSAIGLCKEAKTLEEDFKKAQKPWAKKYTKLMKAKKEFHQACRAEKSAINQENNARADSSVSQDNLRKMSDRVEKNRKDVEATRTKYEAALSDLNSYNAKYMEDMTDVFSASQEREAKRLNHFKEMLFGIHKCLDISENAEIPEIYAQFHATVDQADYERDLKWWSHNHGVDMHMAWPVFEDYSPEMHTISRKEKKAAANNDGVTITKINRNSQHQPSAPPAHHAPPSADTNSLSEKNPFADDDDDVGVDDPDEGHDLEDDGSPGVPVRALYDYEGAEDDELTFKTGDVFEKLRDRDDQGWCKGRKNGKVGLYPDNYVEVIQ